MRRLLVCLLALVSSASACGPLDRQAAKSPKPAEASVSSMAAASPSDIDLVGQDTSILGLLPTLKPGDTGTYRLSPEHSYTFLGVGLTGNFFVDSHGKVVTTVDIDRALVDPALQGFVDRASEDSKTGLFAEWEVEPIIGTDYYRGNYFQFSLFDYVTTLAGKDLNYVSNDELGTGNNDEDRPCFAANDQLHLKIRQVVDTWKPDFKVVDGVERWDVPVAQLARETVALRQQFSDLCLGGQHFEEVEDFGSLRFERSKDGSLRLDVYGLPSPYEVESLDAEPYMLTSITAQITGKADIPQPFNPVSLNSSESIFITKTQQCKGLPNAMMQYTDSVATVAPGDPQYTFTASASETFLCRDELERNGLIQFDTTR